MQLVTKIEYNTVWGEELVLRSAGKSYPMEYAGQGIWRASIDGLDPARDFEYHYELVRDGFMVRREWGSHVIQAAAKGAAAGKKGRGMHSTGQDVADCVKNVTDWWLDVPEDLPLRHVLFAGGQRRFAGTAIPVFSLRSKGSFGVGEFHDLKKMVDWAAMTGQSVIQLLPVNDTTMYGTWEDSYPYNANSTFALHPQFVHLPTAGVKADKEYKALQKELNALPQVDYERVNSEKDRLLRKAFEETWGKVSSSRAYADFFAENSGWLIPYAAFRALRDRFGTPEFGKWKGYSVYDASKVGRFCKKNQAEIDYHCFVQYHLHRQLLDVRRYARAHGVILKGDLPIGISRTSVDAWLYPELFHLDSQAGAPPDAFSSDGQNWGFPTYDWEKMEEDGYAWWKSRLRKMSWYFDAFRIDHILGFFRIWEIPVQYRSGLMGHFSPALPYSGDELRGYGFGDCIYGQEPCDSCCDALKNRKAVSQTDVLFVEDPRKKDYWHPRIGAQSTAAYASLEGWRKDAYNRLYDDFFYRRHNRFWKESALRKLPDLLASTGMIACGEDLGMIPDCVPETMAELQILSLEIQRMPKSMHEEFADPSSYPYYSVCTTSTHDMNPLRAWWEEDHGLSRRFFNGMLGYCGDAPVSCEPWICRNVIEQHLASPAMFTILPLQDWLSIDGGLRFRDPASERINIPANPRHYWRYRMHLPLEELIASSGFNGTLHDMLAASGRASSAGQPQK